MALGQYEGTRTPWTLRRGIDFFANGWWTRQHISTHACNFVHQALDGFNPTLMKCGWNQGFLGGYNLCRLRKHPDSLNVFWTASWSQPYGVTFSFMRRSMFKQTCCELGGCFRVQATGLRWNCKVAERRRRTRRHPEIEHLWLIRIRLALQPSAATNIQTAQLFWRQVIPGVGNQK